MSEKMLAPRIDAVLDELVRLRGGDRAAGRRLRDGRTVVDAARPGRSDLTAAARIDELIVDELG